jgi:hypothetical protein
MRIIHITGPIGSGKTTLDLSLRNELNAINIKGDIARVQDVFFVGRVHQWNAGNYKDRIIKFGGLDDYLRKYNYDINDLLNEIKKQKRTGANYCVMAGIRDFKKHLEKFDGNEFYEIISLRGAERVLKQREGRRGYKGTKKELLKIENEINAYNNEIERWKGLENSNVHLKVFNKSTLFTDRMEYILRLMKQPVRKKGYYKRKFYD